jgi:hypothetical protein
MRINPDLGHWIQAVHDNADLLIGREWRKKDNEKKAVG